MKTDRIAAQLFCTLGRGISAKHDMTLRILELTVCLAYFDIPRCSYLPDHKLIRKKNGNRQQCQP